jgi:hypothetical protein
VAVKGHIKGEPSTPSGQEDQLIRGCEDIVEGNFRGAWVLAPGALGATRLPTGPLASMARRRKTIRLHASTSVDQANDIRQGDD